MLLVLYTATIASITDLSRVFGVGYFLLYARVGASTLAGSVLPDVHSKRLRYLFPDGVDAFPIGYWLSSTYYWPFSVAMDNFSFVVAMMILALYLEIARLSNENYANGPIRQ
jgi:hypothetical protein